jgi:long-subunit acyl-CoA synthetase (AMP-forming)
MISHYNIISNVIQQKIFESVGRTKNNVQTQVISGFLPFSHIYALVAACHSGTYRGDEVIVLPRFEFTAFLRAIQKFKVELLFVVSPHCSCSSREFSHCVLGSTNDDTATKSKRNVSKL